MTYFLIFLAIVVAGAVALYVVGLAKPAPGDSTAGDSTPGDSTAGERAAGQDGFTAPVANLPPVLLPEIPEPEDVDRLRFSLGLRGYRMDQVDDVLDRLRDQLAAKDARIAALEAKPPEDSAP
ncbi:DivIVA domain-containing protein [Paeniglutamicibacter antarcticus]|uniref:DivIVA domain-containing protein n=1 Tax=Arthrobacter terrae TaxID=2935737 RepID=A0A931CT11_9MICC|nr:DivIVA domain-containing protein [Arthrobacter terrae]MBG0740364.1 DivIVA domain-containing protein [Arthrobacter terrae]